MKKVNTCAAGFAFLVLCCATFLLSEVKSCEGIVARSSSNASNHHEAWGILFRVLPEEALRELEGVSDPALALRASWEANANRDSDGLTVSEAEQFLELVKQKFEIQRLPLVWRNIVLDAASLPGNSIGPIDFSVENNHRSIGSSSQLRHSEGFALTRVGNILEIVAENDDEVTFNIEKKLLIGADLTIDKKGELLAVVSYDFNFPGSGKLWLVSHKEVCWQADIWGFAFGASGNAKQYMEVMLTDECVLVFGANPAFIFIEAFDLAGQVLSRFTSAELN